MRTHRIKGGASILLGAGVAAVALLGPLALNVIKHRVSANMENQIIGGDLVSLALAAPLACTAGVLWWRRHRLAPVVAFGPAVYASYLHFQYIVGPEYARYAGNSERFFPLFSGVTVLGLAVALAAWSSFDARELPLPSRGVRVATAGVLLGIGGLLGLAWSKSIYDVASGTLSAEYLEHPALFWLVRTLDLSIVIPAAISTGIGLLRRHPTAVKAAHGVTAGVALLAASVGSMALVMVVRDDPSAEPAFVAVMLPAAIGLALLAGSLWRSCLRGTPDEMTAGRPPIDRPAARRVARTTTA